MLIFIFTFAACTAKDNSTDMTNDNDSDNNDVAIQDDNYKAQTKNVETTDDVTGNNTNDTDNYTNDTGNNTNDTGNYTTSVRDIDDALRSKIDELDNQNLNDMDYPTRTEYYKSRAAAYQTALNNLAKLNPNNKYTNYNDAIRSYYQKGYDLYTNYANRYTTITTTDQEKTFLDELGEEGREIGADIQKGYSDAINALGFRTAD